MTPPKAGVQSRAERGIEKTGFRLSPESPGGFCPEPHDAVIPVKTGIQDLWIPASAGMTGKKSVAQHDNGAFIFRCDRKVMGVRRNDGTGIKRTYLNAYARARE